MSACALPTLEQIGLIFQILGVFLVLFSQARFWFKARRKCGSLKKAFFATISICRVVGDEATSVKKLRETSEEELGKKYPEWWALAEYLSEDIRGSIIGLVFTLVGLLIELYHVTLIA